MRQIEESGPGRPRWHRLLVGLLALALVGGCDTGAAVATPVSGTTVGGCQYKFDATVRQGPSVGLNLRGRLTLMQQTPGDLVHAVGLVVPEGEADAAHAVPVQALLASPALTLTFTLPDGSAITGTGTMEAPLSDCRGTMDGGFTGPAGADTGDWLAGAVVSSVCVGSLRNIIPNMCTAPQFIACCK
jgi:hypothetical protein